MKQIFFLCPNHTNYEVYWIGKKEQGKNRPIKVELGSAIDLDFVPGRAR